MVRNPLAEQSFEGEPVRNPDPSDEVGNDSTAKTDEGECGNTEGATTAETQRGCERGDSFEGYETRCEEAHSGVTVSVQNVSNDALDEGNGKHPPGKG